MNDRPISTTISESAAASPTPTPRSVIRSRLTQPVIVWLLVLALVPLSRLFSPNFPSWALVTSTLVLSTFLALVAFGQGLIILSGGIDLSVPAVISIAAFATGYLSDLGLPQVLAILCAIVLASTVGLINGLIVARSSFPPFIVTLATSTIAAALLLGFSAGAPGQRAPSTLLRIFATDTVALGVVVAVCLFVVAAALGLYVQNRTRLGRRTYAVGNSVVASRIAGINVSRITVQVYWVAAVFYAVAGVLLMGYGSGSDLNIGAPWLLPSIAAVVVGGSAITGGSGRYTGTLGAAVLLTMVSIGISALGLSEGLKQILYGAVVLVALLLTRFARDRA